MYTYITDSIYIENGGGAIFIPIYLAYVVLMVYNAFLIFHIVCLFVTLCSFAVEPTQNDDNNGLDCGGGCDVGEKTKK
jgi:hypothetical protein